MKKLLFVFGALALIAASCNQKANNSANNSPAAQDNQQQQQSAPPQTQNQSNLQTYTNTKYGYTFQYPQNASAFESIDQEAEVSTPAAPDSDNVTVMQTDKLFLPGMPAYFSVVVIPTDLTPQAWIDHNNSTHATPIAPTKAVQFAGRDAIQTIAPSQQGGPAEKEYVLKANGGVMVIYSNTDTLGDIFSSFKSTK